MPIGKRPAVCLPMFDELLSAAYLPFTVAAAIVLLLALLEVAVVVFGIGISSFLDSLLPDIDVGGAEGGGVLAWLGFGQAPFLVVLIVVLAAFAVSGIAIQTVAVSVVGTTLWPVLAVPGALALSLPWTGWMARGLARLIPSEESSGIHRDQLVGRTGIVTQGTATPDRTAEARVVGPKGLRHWIRVRAELGEIIEMGDEVRILARESKVVFIARRRNLE